MGKTATYNADIGCACPFSSQLLQFPHSFFVNATEKEKENDPATRVGDQQEAPGLGLAQPWLVRLFWKAESADGSSSSPYPSLSIIPVFKQIKKYFLKNYHLY